MMLCFHTFEEQSSYPFNFTIQEFLSILELVKSKNILLEVSIDDAHKTTLSAVDKMIALGYEPPLLGIPVNRIESDNCLTWKDVQDLQIVGCEIASHGFDHVELKEENQKYFQDEIIISKQLLEEKLSIKIDSFIYPRGVFCAGAICLIKENYKRAYSILPTSSNNFLLPRHMLSKYNYKNFLNLIR